MRAFVVKVTLGSPCVFVLGRIARPNANGLAATDAVHSLFSQTLQPRLSLLSGPCSADPNNFAPHGIHGSIQDQFNDLSGPQFEATPQSKPFSGPIDNQTGIHFRDSTEIGDKAGAPLRHHSDRAAPLGKGKAEHSFTACFRFRFVRIPRIPVLPSSVRLAHQAGCLRRNPRWGASCNRRPSPGLKN
jgi:hypothetical protein